MQDRDWQAEIRLLRQREKKAREILGVSDTDGADVIKSAWRRLSLEHHPDRNAGSAESHRKFILVNCAYMYLTEKKGCAELDAAPASGGQLADGKYRLDNPWGYFVWWREKYFNQEQ